MKKLLLLLLLLISTLSYAQQLKLGNNPSVLQQSALLELESKSQGLLLPRISDTTVATLQNAPDGMIIYLTLNNSLCIRANGGWRRLIPQGSTAGGDLTGTYPDPQIATGAVTGTKIAQAGATAGQVLKWNGATWAPAADNNSGASSFTLTGDVTGTGTGTAATTISNQSVTFAKMQNINTQKLLGRFGAGTGSMQEITLNNSLQLTTGGILYADSAQPIWNAGKLSGMRVSAKAPANGEVLKWNGTAWETNTDNDGGATYGTLANNDIGYADVAGSTTRMKIWASPVTGTVTNGVTGTTASSWNVLAFKGNGGGFTTQLYFDKNTLAVKEWGGITGPLATNTGNGWYKTVMTNGNTNISNGSILFGNITSDASTEVGQDNARLFWNNTTKRLGVGTNTPASTLSSQGSLSLPIRTFGAGSTTLTESDYTIIKTATGTTNIRLPNAGTCAGRIYVIKKSAGGTLNIDTSGGEIDGEDELIFNNASRASCVVQSDGNNWYVISEL
jgi:hypothetical protein